ncbi:DUF4910 domain-containing protein [Nostoc sp. NOS(2021)]|uniref:DUF4910 domain-containing protein n=1 Tax=Nostoc sp. NOS(2021) TaxID=2815407 RepID=UPI0025EBDD4C|nr:DUF4910 domain-containing protein [Nostoc sp. NOS(2021)]
MLEQALKIDHSPKAIATLFSWLTREETTPLRKAGYIQTALGYYQQAIAKLFTWLNQDETAFFRDEIAAKLLAISGENIPTELKPPQIAIATFIAKYLSQTIPKYSYRFLWIPATLASITWLALNEAKVNNIKHGLVLTSLEYSGNFTYKKSRRGDTKIDKVAAYVLRNSKQDYKIIDFFPYGYDERQYCSPGFNLEIVG